MTTLSEVDVIELEQLCDIAVHHIEANRFTRSANDPHPTPTSEPRSPPSPNASCRQGWGVGWRRRPQPAGT